MELTKKQAEALDLIIQRYKAKEKYSVIGGYAGTGKSTLVKFVIDALAQEGIDPNEDVCFCAYTGKATQVLQKKGNKNVKTLHKLLYDSFPKGDGGFYRKPKFKLEYRIIVVDEVSMAPKKMMDLLFSHKGIYVICMGDPFQLPPVQKEDNNQLLDTPHVFLDEIMRQAAESEIIRLSMAIRNQQSLSSFSGKEVIVASKKDITTGMLTWADQILCATNKTRSYLNSVMRTLLGREELPQEGDKVICLRNYWECLSEEGNPLVNGCIGFLSNLKKESFFLPPSYNFIRPLDVLKATFVTETGEEYGTRRFDNQMILTGNKQLDFKTEFKMSKTNIWSMRIPMEFVYAYAITVHKSQGSEWDKVLVQEEGFPFDKTEHARWLYTACTRASEKLVLLR